MRKLGVIWAVTYLDAGALSPRCEIYVVSNGNSDICGHPRPMMEGECLVQFTYAKEYTLCAIQWILSVDLCRLPVIPWVLLGIATVIIARFLLRKYPAWDSKKKDSKGHPNKPRHEKWFYAWIIGVAVLGGTWAFLFPLAINADFSKNGDGAALRQTLIYTTGGLLGVITLGETRHKNDQEHMRQVHAERRSRYATAIEQLADEKAPIRLGGVYTLVKLVDDWLDDEKTLPSKDERRKEGQIIIDSLCAYIRSSFPLAERYDELTLSYEEYQQNCQGNQDLHNPQIIPIPKPKNAKQSREDFMRDKSLLREEQEVRKTILSEIKNRLNGGKTKNKDDRDEIEPGTWSYFEYDFSNAIFFYSANFSNSLFGSSSNFTQAAFTEGAEFSGTKFTNYALFSECTFFNYANFSEVIFAESANFSRAEFIIEYVNFSKALFKNSVNFFSANFRNGYAVFSGATFFDDVILSGVIFHNKPQFENSPGDKTKTRFSNKYNFRNFTVSPDSHYKIETEKHRSPNGTITTIPRGCSVFNPSLTKISISDDNIKGISVKGVSANGVPQVQEKLEMSPWPKKSESNTKH